MIGADMVEHAASVVTTGTGAESMNVSVCRVRLNTVRALHGRMVTV